MKRCIVAVAVFIVCLTIVPAAVLAQTQADEEEMLRSVLQTGKKAIIIDNMGFTEDESKAFWHVYNDFQQDKQKLN